MLNGVSDVLTPWTAPRILHIMETASAFRKRGGNPPRGGVPADGAADMESLLQLANQLPDVAGRVMAAPLFAQRPLVESHNSGPLPLTTVAPGAPSDEASSTSIIYEDARNMCTAALAVHRSAWRAEAPNDGEPSRNDQSFRWLHHSEAQTAAAELEEVRFAAEFSEPCIRGSFPDVAAALRHVLPEVDGGILSASGEVHVQGTSNRGAPNLFQDRLSFMLSPPSVSHATLPVKSVSSPNTINGGGSTTTHRLRLIQPSPSAASAEQQSLVLETIPPPSLLSIEAYGPPGHAMFDRSCVAYTFSSDEREELMASLCTKPLPLQVFRNEEVEVRCGSGALIDCEASTPLSIGIGAAATAPVHVAHDGLPLSASRGAQSRRINGDGWSVSSGWSSRSNSEPRDNMDRDKAKEEASQDMEKADAANSEAEPPNRAVTADRDALTPELTSAVRLPSAVSTTRTWINDDDHLVLENGRITVQKKKMRPVKNMLACHPLPTVVRAPFVDPSLLTAEVSTRLAEGQGFTSGITDDTGHVNAMNDGSTVECAPDGKKRVAGAKRSRDSTTVSAPVHEETTSTSADPQKKITAGTKTGVKRSAASAEVSGEVARVPTDISTRPVVRLSQEEMLEFIEGLRVSDTLRRALLVGAAAPAVTQAAPVNTPGTVGEGQGETGGVPEAH
ncbi:hypothetical protein JKF63_02072 [Porcisia hertigi]|uniref:Uncharacterized protein n=1 Tax=Porcisia hertigi TaxID=2761500 RepID=A0A836L571_9TRYP|nr:hypothetical protein JKF63_02072 [Porcisia hertigi]